MTSNRFLTVATLIGVLAVAPAYAQDGRARPRNPGAAREAGGGQGRGGQDGGRTQSAGPGRSYDSGRVDRGDRGRSAVPREAYRAPEAPREYRQAAPVARDDDYSRGARRRDDGRYQAPRYDNRYDNRTYNRPYSRPDAVGRAVPRPYGYVGPRYAPPPRYVAPNWRGGWNSRGWGYYHPSRGWYDPYRRGWYGTRVYVTPRFISPRIVTVLPYEPFYYRPSLGLGVYYGSGGLAPFGAIPPAFYNPSDVYGLGGVRITDAPRDAQVFVDGAYAGIVDDFDGVFQHINVEGGRHRIEIHHPNFQPVAFDVFVEPGRTITLRADW